MEQLANMPDCIEMDGLMYGPCSEFWNISTLVDKLMKYNLLEEVGHPINGLKQYIIDVLNVER